MSKAYRLQKTFMRCLARHPNPKIREKPDMEQIKRLRKIIHEEDLRRCRKCQFVGYVLIRCKKHWSKAFRKSLE